MKQRTIVIIIVNQTILSDRFASCMSMKIFLVLKAGLQFTQTRHSVGDCRVTLRNYNRIKSYSCDHVASTVVCVHVCIVNQPPLLLKIIICTYTITLDQTLAVLQSWAFSRDHNSAPEDSIMTLIVLLYSALFSVYVCIFLSIDYVKKKVMNV